MIPWAVRLTTIKERKCGSAFPRKQDQASERQGDTSTPHETRIARPSPIVDPPPPPTPPAGRVRFLHHDAGPLPAGRMESPVPAAFAPPDPPRIPLQHEDWTDPRDPRTFSAPTQLSMDRQRDWLARRVRRPGRASSRARTLGGGGRGPARTHQPSLPSRSPKAAIRLHTARSTQCRCLARIDIIPAWQQPDRRQKFFTASPLPRRTHKAGSTLMSWYKPPFPGVFPERP